MSLLGILLIITSFFVASAKINRTRLLVCCVAVLSLLNPSGLYINGVSKDFDTAYNRYLIRDVGSVRALQGDYLTWQSAVYKIAASRTFRIRECFPTLPRCRRKVTDTS